MQFQSKDARRFSSRRQFCLTLGSLVTGTCLFASGCAGLRRRADIPPPPPAAITPAATSAEIVAAINRNVAIDQLSTNSAKISVVTTSLPKLRANIHLRRDRDFRLQGNVPFVMGSGIDIGSNENQYWFELPEPTGRVKYYATHEASRRRVDRSLMSVDPTWLIDAIGLLKVNADDVISQPLTRSDGLLELRTRVPMPSGDYQRIIYVHAEGGYVTDQIMYDPSGREIAYVHTSDHVFYSVGENGVVLPHQVEIRLSDFGGQPVGMRIEIEHWAVNQILSGDPALFSMPPLMAGDVNLDTY